MFPQKFSFEELKARNIKVSGLHNRIHQINSTLYRKKKGKRQKIVLAQCGS